MRQLAFFDSANRARADHPQDTHRTVAETPHNLNSSRDSHEAREGDNLRFGEG